MSEQEYGTIAKRRYKGFKKGKRRESMKKKIISFLFKLLRAVVILLKKARIIRTRKVETVKVESVAVEG